VEGLAHGPFLYTGVTYVLFQSKGSSPWCNIALYMSVRAGTMLTEVSLNYLMALHGYNSCNSWSTPSVVMLIGICKEMYSLQEPTVGVELVSVKTAETDHLRW